MNLSGARMGNGLNALGDVSYSPYALEAHRWKRYEQEPPLVSNAVLSIGLAAFLLLALISADVGAYNSIPVKVTISQVNWFVGNVSVGNQTGFNVAGGHQFAQNLVCELFCYEFSGATVGSPFTLVSCTIQYPWFEYVNLTVQAPHFAYTGDLNITLKLP